jgi:hypothetical protein
MVGKNKAMHTAKEAWYGGTGVRKWCVDWRVMLCAVICKVYSRLIMIGYKGRKPEIADRRWRESEVMPSIFIPIYALRPLYRTM